MKVKLAYDNARYFSVPHEDMASALPDKTGPIHPRLSTPYQQLCLNTYKLMDYAPRLECKCRCMR